MRFVLAVILFAIVGPLMLSRRVRAQNGPYGGGGKFATSLCAELITPNGYNCTEYQAVTDDGFILGLQNMPSPRGVAAPCCGPPVLLIHGLVAAGDNWCDNNPQESLAFILADAGFDVWIGNHRAVQWSHGHQTLEPFQDAYWAWTYDELASYDLKALTKFVFNQRGGRKLIYIGHSQGTLVLFAGLTGGQFKTEILEYLNATVLLAPVTSVANLTASILKAGLAIYADKIFPLIGNGEFNANIFYNVTCTDILIIPPLLCNDVYTGVAGQNTYLNQSRLGFYSQYYVQPTSSFNVNHFGQNNHHASGGTNISTLGILGYRRNNFAFYDRGLLGNLNAYNQTTPPIYNLTTFPSSLPFQFWSGGIDGLADPTDVAALLAKLPSSNREVHTLANYGHLDFVMGTNAYLDVYPTLITFLRQHS